MIKLLTLSFSGKKFEQFLYLEPFFVAVEISTGYGK